MMSNSTNRVSPLAVAALEGINLQARLLDQTSTDESANAVGLPAGGFHDLGQRSAVGLFEHSVRKPILNHTKRGELVYEPFLGSGTTLAAAEVSQRHCCGMELDPKYIDVVVRRWQTLAGKEAILDGDGRTFEQIAVERLGHTAESAGD